ncbi:hypothetical protein SDC9_193324 [bioreactor metagenome]|uniref:Uncharacterized protein n=1 Tax=bioreactor metagenome TaxID=1076179 RepID=A0A645IEC3_9ZZZZ
MEFDVAKANTPVRVCHDGKNIRRCAARGHAHMHKILRVRIHAPDFLKNCVAYKVTHFLLGMFAV